MQLRLETTLACPPALARDQVSTPLLLRRVAWPLLVFSPVGRSHWPERWEPGEHWVRLRAFGVVPLGRQRIGISYPPPRTPGEFLVRDDGGGTLIRRWDHLIRLTAGPDGTTTRYEDRVDVEAGVLTVPAWVFAHVFYRWRQHRWRRLARRGFR